MKSILKLITEAAVKLPLTKLGHEISNDANILIICQKLNAIEIDDKCEALALEMAKNTIVMIICHKNNKLPTFIFLKTFLRLLYLETTDYYNLFIKFKEVAFYLNEMELDNERVLTKITS